jgi:hypothetical protein
MSEAGERLHKRGSTFPLLPEDTAEQFKFHTRRTYTPSTNKTSNILMPVINQHTVAVKHERQTYEDVSKSLWTGSVTKYTLTTINTH